MKGPGTLDRMELGMKFLGKRRLIFGAVTVMVLGIVSLGYAAWTSSGGGTGFAKAASAQNLTTASVTGTTSATLFPGATGDLVVNVTNPNSYPIKVTSVTGNGTIAADSGHSTCGQDAQHPTGVTYTDQTGLSIAVAANSSSQVTLSGSVKMTNASDNSCQGATFSVPVSMAATSNAS
jgi:hypothetical protein